MKIVYLLCYFALVFSCKSTSKNTIPAAPIDHQKVSEHDTTSNEIKTTEIEVLEPSKEADTVKVLTNKNNHQDWNILLQKHVSTMGNVSYKGFKEDIKQLETYLDYLSNNAPKSTWSHKQKLAFWLNAYNAFTVKLILDKYPLKSIKDIKDPWDLEFFTINNKAFSLNKIEHKILRKMNDPRIHFGINCASYSCPLLSNIAFNKENVDQELEKLTIGFINDSKRNKISSKKIKLSKLFSWFGKDFKTEGSLISFLNKYSKIQIQKNASKSYLDYNWSLNE